MNIDELSKKMDCDDLDSTFENKIAKILSNTTTENASDLLNTFLLSDKYQVRMMGLRLIKRCLKDKKSFDNIIKQCFEVGRLTELQHWYSAILSRYPISSFTRKLKNEFEKKEDRLFYERHIRALQLHLANTGDRGRKQLDRVQQYKPDE